MGQCPCLDRDRPVRTVALLYDPGMLKHDAHLSMWNPGENFEKPERIERVYARLEQEGLVARCMNLPCRPAVREELELKHTKEHIDSMFHLEMLSDEEAAQMAGDSRGIFFCSGSMQAALLAAGAVIDAVLAVCTGQVQSAFAIVRPPGHHAEPDRAKGFSLFGSTGLAVAKARKLELAKRVLIVDWDVHHGNGTQRFFEQDDTVLYFSVHGYDDGTFYPRGSYGNYTSHGCGVGEGFTVNIPWQIKQGSPAGSLPPGDAEMYQVWKRILMPIAHEFRPDLVVVNAGFDAAVGDPLAPCLVSPACFHALTTDLMSLAGGRIVLALEGGYNTEMLCACSVACVHALLGHPPPSTCGCCRELQDCHARRIEEVRKHYASFWPMLKNGPD